MFRSLLVVACLTLACNPAHEPSAQPESEGGLREIPIDPAVVTASYEDWAYREQLESDLDGDAGPETIILSADVELNAAGEPLWEDGHRWVLWVAGEDAPQPLYGAFVPRGRVEAAVAEEDHEGRRPLLVLERTPDRIRVIDIAYADGTASVRSEGFWYPERWLTRSR